MTIKEKIKNDLHDAMRARDKQTLEALRFIMASLKQVEIDERIDLDDARIVVLLDKLAKQRKESINQFKQANRADLVAKEEFELNLINVYLPQPFTDDEVQKHIDAAVIATNAVEMRDMGKVMAYLKPVLQGRADMSKVSCIIKSKLS